MPKFTAAQPEVADWSEGVWVASVPIQQFPQKTGALSQPLRTGQQLPQYTNGLELPWVLGFLADT